MINMYCTRLATCRDDAVHAGPGGVLCAVRCACLFLSQTQPSSRRLQHSGTHAHADDEGCLSFTWRVKLTRRRLLLVHHSEHRHHLVPDNLPRAALLAEGFHFGGIGARRLDRWLNPSS